MFTSVDTSGSIDFVGANETGYTFRYVLVDACATMYEMVNLWLRLWGRWFSSEEVKITSLTSCAHIKHSIGHIGTTTCYLVWVTKNRLNGHIVCIFRQFYCQVSNIKILIVIISHRNKWQQEIQWKKFWNSNWEKYYYYNSNINRPTSLTVFMLFIWA